MYEPAHNRHNNNNNEMQRSCMRKDRKQIAGAIAATAASALILGAAAYFFFTPVALADEDRTELRDSGAFFDGISVEGVDIGGMTVDEARLALAPVEESMERSVFLTLAFEGSQYTVSSEDMNIAFNTEDVLFDALMYAREGNYAERTQKKLSADECVFEISYTLDAQAAGEHAAALCAPLAFPPEDAAVTYTPTGEEKFGYTPEKYGVEVDTAALLSAVSAACGTHDLSPIDVPYKALAPSVTEELLRSVTVLRSSFSTSFAESPYNDANRVYNIKKCVELINGSDKHSVPPGGTFSVNSVLGKRTAANGWREAPGYTGGRTVDQPGGGVCQISTTLYCAALSSDMEIVERTNHSIPVGYSKKGLDATISTGGPDLVIKNNTAWPLYIYMYATDDKALHCEIYGSPFEGFSHIMLDSEKVRDIEPDGEMVYTVDETQPADYEEVYIKRRTGSYWRTYKIYMDGENEVSRKQAEPSTYKAYRGETVVGTP